MRTMNRVRISTTSEKELEERRKSRRRTPPNPVVILSNDAPAPSLSKRSLASTSASLGWSNGRGWWACLSESGTGVDEVSRVFEVVGMMGRSSSVRELSGRGSWWRDMAARGEGEKREKKRDENEAVWGKGSVFVPVGGRDGGVAHCASTASLPTSE